MARNGSCRLRLSEIHGGYTGPTVMRGPIGYLERMKDAEIRALGRWLDADTAARLLGRSVSTVQRWGQDGCLRSRGILVRADTDKRTIQMLKFVLNKFINL